MRVRMKAGITGTRDGSPWPPIGGEIVVPDIEGATLCSQGLAEPVAEPSKPERAVNSAPEKRGRRGRPDAG